MSGRIITARHGRPNLARDLTISASEYGDWWARYDASGLHPDEAAPQALIALAGRAATVLSSTLPRAIETARQVTKGDRDIAADPIFVEAALPPPPIPGLKLRPGQWGVISRIFWSLGYAPEGVESCNDAWKRVDLVIDRLCAHAERGDVLLCAHGFLNWMIDKRLRVSGWRRSAREGGNHFWSWRIYERAPGRQAARTAPAIAE